MRLRLEVEGGRLAVPAHLDVVSLRGPGRHAVVRQIRQRERESVALGFHRFELGLVLLDQNAVLLPGPNKVVELVGLVEVAGRLAGLLRLGDLLAHILACATCGLQHRE